jgi:hypothetical protein
MTLNGNDFHPGEVAQLLRNALAQGTGYGFEFVSTFPSSKDPFTLYNNDWSPKPVMAVVDNQWDKWLREMSKLEHKLKTKSGKSGIKD